MMGCKFNVVCAVFIGVTVFIRCTDSIDLPMFVGPGSNVTVAVGRDASLTCTVDNLQTFKVAWLCVDTQTILTIAGHVITKNHRVSVSHGDGSWTLSLRDVSTTDGGRYMCQINTEPMMSQTHQLLVVVPPDIDDARSSSEVTIEEFGDVALYCSSSGVPPPVILWRREDSRHFHLDNRTRVSKWSGPWLNMTGVDRTSSGAYLCIASNGVPPSVSKRISINVLFGPTVRAGRVAARVSAGGAPILTCIGEAAPSPRIHWTHNDLLIYNGSKYQMWSSSLGWRHTWSLRVLEVSVKDAGEYRCAIENRLGKDSAVTFLHLLTTTTTTTTTTTSTTTTTTTTTTTPPTTTILDDNSIHLEQLHQDVFGESLGDPYIVLSQHQMQNLEMATTL